jgi:D-aminoacyl-tRNA deacylase
MKAVLQRVSRAHVVVLDETVGAIGPGLLVLLCAERGDTYTQADKLLAKILKLRIFPDRSDAGQTASVKMNLSVQDVAGSLLVVSQFTLAADVSGGNRPSFTQAAPSEDGQRLYDYFVQQARAAQAPQGTTVATGRFGADMQVHSVNDGPVTLIVQTDGW